jgi:hypothetical protein
MYIVKHQLLNHVHKKNFITSPYYKKEKKRKRYTDLFSPTTPSHTTKKIKSWKINHAFPCHPKTNPLG